MIIIGAGGVGTAAAGEVARRGARAIAIDRFAPGHDQGSSHGQTRIIRQAYFEHPDYVPLLLEAYRLWHRLEDRRGERLLDPVGLVEIGLASGTVVTGVLARPPRTASTSSDSLPGKSNAAFQDCACPSSWSAFMSGKRVIYSSSGPSELRRLKQNIMAPLCAWEKTC